MSAKRKTTVGVIFGGRSVEHDVSVVTGHQIMRAFDLERYEVVPIYIDREGQWFTGEPLNEIKNFDKDVTRLDGVLPTLLSPSVQHHGLIINPTPSGMFAKSQVKRLDVAFPAIHGSHGEDGTLQGLFELADIPYVGCGVLASAIANDKLVCKEVLRQAGIPVVNAIGFTREEWLTRPDEIVQQITAEFSYPLYVKPVTLGSSIGVARADDDKLLRPFIDVAASLDRKILVEEAITNCVEINCSVLGDDRGMQASVLEQPLSVSGTLSFEDKYLGGTQGMKSADRIIPAPLDDELTDKIQKTAIKAFRAIDGRGITRIDFLIRPDSGEIFLNEMNTLPGSLSFYLWEPTGIKHSELVDKLVRLAQDAYAEKRRSSYNYQTNLLSLTAARGIKGTKK
ncbi:MAG TPA: D-alanine--D-alanine ligase family protein [Phototrophicaceae bacterium]|nr:D-alanine--D-alanine ligase family protein [Phototrophicaceae bacterium]